MVNIKAQLGQDFIKNEQLFSLVKPVFLLLV